MSLKVRKVSATDGVGGPKGINPPKFNESSSKPLAKHRKMPAEASKARQGSGENQGLK